VGPAEASTSPVILPSVPTTGSGRSSPRPNPPAAQLPPLDDLIRGDPSALNAVTHSGATIPGCPAAGLQLLPGFPAPYRFFSTNPANNWCMPNGPDNSCTAFPDTKSVAGITIYDFRAACRQHDLGYRWVPASKIALDARIFVDAAADCARRNLVIRPFCFSWAAVLFTGVFLFGGPSYGNSVREGYTGRSQYDRWNRRRPARRPATRGWPRRATAPR
jgi:hypothetical protein